MIASVDRDRDFDIYLTHEEVEKITHCVVDGVLIRLHKPKQQGKINICLCDDKRNLNGFGIGIEDNWPWANLEGEVKIYVGDSFYEDLVENGRTGTRYGHMGSKIHLYDCSRIDFTMKAGFEHLEFYRDNREKLHASFG